MMKKKKSNTNAKRRGRSNSHKGLVYLIIGITLGVIFAGLLLQNQKAGQTLRNVVAKLQGTHPSAKPENAKPKKTPAVTTKPVSSTPQFDFYTMLPQMQVDVGGSPPAQSGHPPPTSSNSTMPAAKTAAPVLTGGNQYTLQVASFRNFADADKVRARLALQGFNAHIKPINVNGLIWNRVYIGPFSSLASAQNTQQALTAQKINSFIVANAAN